MFNSEFAHCVSPLCSTDFSTLNAGPPTIQLCSVAYLSRIHSGLIVYSLPMLLALPESVGGSDERQRQIQRIGSLPPTFYPALDLVDLLSTSVGVTSLSGSSSEGREALREAPSLRLILG